MPNMAGKIKLKKENPPLLPCTGEQSGILLSHTGKYIYIYISGISPNLGKDAWWNSRKIWNPEFILSLFFFCYFCLIVPSAERRNGSAASILSRLHGPQNKVGVGTFAFPVQIRESVFLDNWRLGRTVLCSWVWFPKSFRSFSFSFFLSLFCFAAAVTSSESWQNSLTWLVVNEDFNND